LFTPWLRGWDIDYTDPAYDVELSNAAKAGGVSGAVGHKDSISKGTACLFEKFANGTLDSLLGTFVYDNASVAGLPDMIWYLEGEKRP